MGNTQSYSRELLNQFKDNIFSLEVLKVFLPFADSKLQYKIKKDYFQKKKDE